MLAFQCLIECSDLNRWQCLTVEGIVEQQYIKKERHLVFMFSRTEHDDVVSGIPCGTIDRTVSLRTVK